MLFFTMYSLISSIYSNVLFMHIPRTYINYWRKATPLHHIKLLYTLIFKRIRYSLCHTNVVLYDVYDANRHQHKTPLSESTPICPTKEMKRALDAFPENRFNEVLSGMRDQPYKEGQCGQKCPNYLYFLNLIRNCYSLIFCHVNEFLYWGCPGPRKV